MRVPVGRHKNDDVYKSITRYRYSPLPDIKFVLAVYPKSIFGRR